MAEQVQAILDQMVPALRDLMDKGIFTETEVKAIVTRRRESEYLLRRRAARKSDFARYIQAETNLEKLRSLRNKRLLTRKAAKDREEKANNNKKNKKDDKKKKSTSTSSIGDASIVQHIHFLYARAKRKFKSDLTWHLQHAEFAKKSCSFNMLGQIYAEALQIHPRNTSLWIEAASHEFFGYVADKNGFGMSGGGSIKNARVLLQRGVRVNATSQELWIQQFCLEFHYIQKLRGRRELLQLGMKKIVDEEEDDASSKPDQIDSFYKEAKLPRVIFKNAIKAIPTDVSFRLRFIDCCQMFPETETLQDDIMATIEKDFGNVEEAWIARAQYLIENPNSDLLKKERDSSNGFFRAPLPVDGDDDDDDAGDDTKEEISKKRKRDEDFKSDSSSFTTSVLALLDKATDSIKTPDMYIQTLSFLQWYIGSLSDQQSSDDSDEIIYETIDEIGQFFDTLMKKGTEDEIVSPDFCLYSADVQVALGRPLDATKYLQQMVKENSECQKDSRCWLKLAHLSNRIELMIETPTTTKSKSRKTQKILRNALGRIPFHEKGHLKVLSQYFLNLLSMDAFDDDNDGSSVTSKEISATFQKILLLSHQNNNDKNDEQEDDRSIVSIPSLSLSYLRHAILAGDLHTAREIYNQVLFNSNCLAQRSLQQPNDIMLLKIFYDSCISFESISKEQGSKEVRLRKLCSGASTFFSKNGNDVLAEKYTKKIR